MFESYNRIVFGQVFYVCRIHFVIIQRRYISPNPGPAKSSISEFCAVCLKVIKKKQSRLDCKTYKQDNHLKCLGDDFEISGLCRLCCAAESSADATFDSIEQYLFEKLHDTFKLRGIKIIHQNIQSLGPKIDQVRLILRELKSRIQLVTLSETWLKRDVGDGEFKIPGYRLCRKDRDAKNGGVAGYSYFEKGCRKKMWTRQCRKII